MAGNLDNDNDYTQEDMRLSVSKALTFSDPRDVGGCCSGQYGKRALNDIGNGVVCVPSSFMSSVVLFSGVMVHILAQVCD